MNKKICILWHNGGRLANQLWLFISVYAYALEKKYSLENHTFFEYSEYFEIPQKNIWVNLLFFKPYWVLGKIFPKKLSALRRCFFKYYKVYVKLVEKFYKSHLVFAVDDSASKIHYLAPSENVDTQVEAFEKNNGTKLYLDGWLFRNPVGIEKYRKEITAYFRPKLPLWDRVQKRVVELRGSYKHFVGVHVRQGDYKYLWNGERYFKEVEVSNILHEYLENTGKKNDEVIFAIASDGKIDLTAFKGLNVVLSGFIDPVEDLFFLSEADVIIGSDSTFGAFASYYGNIPFVVFQKNKIDWAYYLGKTGYFENKYASFVRY